MQYCKKYRTNIVILLIACLFMSSIIHISALNISTSLNDFNYTSNYPYQDSFNASLLWKTLNSSMLFLMNYSGFNNTPIQRFLPFSKNVLGINKQYFESIYLSNNGGILRFFTMPILFTTIEIKEMFLHCLYSKDGKV